MSDIESIVRKHAESFDYGAFDGDDNLIKFSGNGLSNLIAEIRKEQAAKIEQLTKERDEALTRLSGQTYFVPPEISGAYQALQEDYNEQAAHIAMLSRELVYVSGAIQMGMSGYSIREVVAGINAALSATKQDVAKFIDEIEAKAIAKFIEPLLDFIESNDGEWSVILRYDNYQDGAQILTSNGVCVMDCYDLDAKPDEQFIRAITKLAAEKRMK